MLFSHWPYAVGAEPPHWLSNPLTGHCVKAPERGWWDIPDFDDSVGDIKLVWELSRMDWTLAFAQRIRNGDRESLSRLNHWLHDWCKKNPPYRGPNWKCGQEASIRLMHLAMAALIMGQVNEPEPGLLALMHLHLRRIAPTLQYAMAQDNNHGTSEAAALFIGGSWLAALGVAEGERWEKTGRRWLENLATRLIGADGSFSQHSLNYHRVMLDTFCMAEVWRRHMGLPFFAASCYERVLAAATWLYNLISPQNGDGPNLGANDGARLLQLTDTVYRDYRPSVQTAMVLFASQRAYARKGPWDYPLYWLGIPLPEKASPAPASYVSDVGGFAMLRCGAALVVLRYPRFQFRPSQADALHLDLWVDGVNLLRDAGTYSYNSEPYWMNYFTGTSGHNTVQFDDRNQMPRLSRFLFGDWLKTSYIEPLINDEGETRFAAGYRDGFKVSHKRHVCLSNSRLRVTDEVDGFQHNAVLRWRLAPGEWRLAGTGVVNGAQTLSVQASMPIIRCELVEGWESRHYHEKTPVPVLEIEVRHRGTFKTDVCWAS